MDESACGLSAAEIARKALEEEERPERERLAREKLTREQAEARLAKATERAAQKRLLHSALPRWFPGVEWAFVERSSSGVLLHARQPLPGQFDVWQSGKDRDYNMIRLAVHDNGNVYFATVYGFSHDRQRYEWDWLVLVHSAADVARAQDDYNHRTAVPANAE